MPVRGMVAAPGGRGYPYGFPAMQPVYFGYYAPYPGADFAGRCGGKGGYQSEIRSCCMHSRSQPCCSSFDLSTHHLQAQILVAEAGEGEEGGASHLLEP
jgi:hypothetical protein